MTEAPKKYELVAEDTIEGLSLKAGVEMPRVYSSAQATDAITRLEERLHQPQLEGFRL